MRLVTIPISLIGIPGKKVRLKVVKKKKVIVLTNC